MISYFDRGNEATGTLRVVLTLTKMWGASAGLRPQDERDAAFGPLADHRMMWEHSQVVQRREPSAMSAMLLYPA